MSPRAQSTALRMVHQQQLKGEGVQTQEMCEHDAVRWDCQNLATNGVRGKGDTKRK